MARRTKRNPHETQTKLSLALAVVGALGALGMIVCVLWRFDFAEFSAPYVTGSLRFFAIIGSAIMGVAAGGIGFLVSFNCAGQKRNPLSSLAWKTFFANALIVTVTLSMALVFFFAREAVR